MKSTARDILYTTGLFLPVKKFLLLFLNPLTKRRVRVLVHPILCKIEPLFKEFSEDYWLDYGTLLGFFREGKIIEGDDDLDFGLITNDGLSISRHMEEAGFEIIKQVKVEGKTTFEQYVYKGFRFDLFYYRREGGSCVTNTWLPDHYNVPQKVAYEKGECTISETTFLDFNTKEIVFYNCMFRVPENEESYLSQHFGEDFMTPSSDWTYADEKNRVIVSKEYEVNFYT